MPEKMPEKNPDKPETKAPAKPRTYAQLRSEYQSLLEKVQKAEADGRKLERVLLEEVKQKVKAQAGDVRALLDQKRAVYAEMTAAQQREATEAAAMNPTAPAKK